MYCYVWACISYCFAKYCIFYSGKLRHWAVEKWGRNHIIIRVLLSFGVPFFRAHFPAVSLLRINSKSRNPDLAPNDSLTVKKCARKICRRNSARWKCAREKCEHWDWVHIIILCNLIILLTWHKWILIFPTLLCTMCP